MTRAIEYKPRADRTGYPLALVECTRCGLRFTSAAQERTKCPECHRSLRVNRATRRRAPVARQPVNTPAVRQETRTVRQPAPFRPPPVVAVPAVGRLGRFAETSSTGDETYIFDRGRLVLAAWQNGKLVAASELPAGYLAAALAARGWRLRPREQGICQVVQVWAAVAEISEATEPCRRPAVRGVLCEKCFAILRTPA